MFALQQLVLIITPRESKLLRKCAIKNGSYCLLLLLLRLLLVVILVIRETCAEFRFCHEGKWPHKIRETACPGGFIAFTPLNVTCMFYAKGPDVSELIAKFDADMCDGTTDGEIELDPAGRTNFAESHLLHKVLFELQDEFSENTPGVEIHDETCALECLNEWVNPLEPEDEPMRIDKPFVTNDEKRKYELEYVQRSRELFTTLTRDKYLFDDVLDDDPVNFITNLLQSPIYTGPGFHSIIKLLAKSMRITVVQCNPFVETGFYEQVLLGMIHFHETNKIHPVVEIHPAEFLTIYKYLDACEKAVNTRFVMNGTHCEKTHAVDTIINLDFDSGGLWKYRRKSLSFRWGVYDPLVEAAWVAVDFVHGFCFETFHAAEDVLHFHLYIQAMEALFPFEPVQKHWMYPVKLKNDEFWNAMLETENIKHQMRNLDACATAAYLKKGPYRERLLRLFVNPEQIENPQFAPNDDGANTKGWGKSVPEYWSWYERQGSFKEFSKSFGYCLDGSKEDLDAAEKSLKETGMNCQSEII